MFLILYLFVFFVRVTVFLSIWVSLCMIVCLSKCLLVWVSVCMIVCLSTCLLVWVSVCLSVCLYECLFVLVSVCLSVRLSVTLPGLCVSWQFWRKTKNTKRIPVEAVQLLVLTQARLLTPLLLLLVLIALLLHLLLLLLFLLKECLCQVWAEWAVAAQAAWSSLGAEGEMVMNPDSHIDLFALRFTSSFSSWCTGLTDKSTFLHHWGVRGVLKIMMGESGCPPVMGHAADWAGKFVDRWRLLRIRMRRMLREWEQLNKNNLATKITRNGKDQFRKKWWDVKNLGGERSR